MHDLFIIAHILRPHGLRGDVVVRPDTQTLSTLTGARHVYLGLDAKGPVKVQGVRMHKGNPLLKLEGVDDMDGALALKGVEVCLPRDELAPLEEGEYFLHELMGLTLLDHLEREIGPVQRIVETGGPPVLVGVHPDGKEFMVPFASGTIDDVDLEKGTIRLVNLPGLIED